MFQVELQELRGPGLRYGMTQDETSPVVTGSDRCASGKKQPGHLLPRSSERIIQRRPFVHVLSVDFRACREQRLCHGQAVPANLRVGPFGSDLCGDDDCRGPLPTGDVDVGTALHETADKSGVSESGDNRQCGVVVPGAIDVNTAGQKSVQQLHVTRQYATNKALLQYTMGHTLSVQGQETSDGFKVPSFGRFDERMKFTAFCMSRHLSGRRG